MRLRGRADDHEAHPRPASSSTGPRPLNPAEEGQSCRKQAPARTQLQAELRASCGGAAGDVVAAVLHHPAR
eukprot:2241078-Alexandrium_andersonii.AAC.1